MTDTLNAARERLSQLLREQERLSHDLSPQGDARYREVVAKIAAAQSEIDALRQGATP